MNVINPAGVNINYVYILYEKLHERYLVKTYIAYVLFTCTFMNIDVIFHKCLILISLTGVDSTQMLKLLRKLYLYLCIHSDKKFKNVLNSLLFTKCSMLILFAYETITQTQKTEHMFFLGSHHNNHAKIKRNVTFLKHKSIGRFL